MITILGITVVLGVLLVARYGADSRGTGDPTGRDAAWPRSPQRAHTPGADARVLAALTASVARRIAAHRRAWELFDAAQRPWEADPGTVITDRVADPAVPEGFRHADGDHGRTARRRPVGERTSIPAHLAVPAPRPTGDDPCPRAA